MRTNQDGENLYKLVARNYLTPSLYLYWSTSSMCGVYEWVCVYVFLFGAAAAALVGTIDESFDFAQQPRQFRTASSELTILVRDNQFASLAFAVQFGLR